MALGLAQQVAQAQFDPVIELSNLDGSNGFAINGVNPFERAGQSVSGTGDINADGINDVIIGSPFAINNSITTGNSYVVFGSDIGFPTSLELSDINGSNGFIINGLDPANGVGLTGNFGFSVSYAGDVNDDGMDDLIIGAPRADSNGNNDPGNSYVIFGSGSAFPNPFDPSTLNGSNGFSINGVADGDLSGYSVSAAGDINGDGVDDLIIGALDADSNGGTDTGSNYVIFGVSGGLPNPFNLSTINGINGITINGVAEDDHSGDSVSGLGDINGDGLDDFILGAFGSDPGGNDDAGSSYVVFGAAGGGLPHPFDLTSLNGSNGFRLDGVAENDRSGRSFNTAGDINGDGINDLVVGINVADPGGLNNAGSVYVLYGSTSSWPSSMNINDINGVNGFVINGLAASDFLGASVGTAGDLNADGIDDLIIGATGADINGIINAGKSYVLFGSVNPIPHPFNLSSLDGNNGFTIHGIGVSDFVGGEVDGVGDVNGDGIDDLIMGAGSADPNGLFDAGSSYVVFGSDLVFKGGFE